MATMDVTNLFINVPVIEIIKIITDHVYHHPTLPPPNIQPQHLTEILKLCTMESPFRDPDGKLYLQIDGVAMGSPLGPTFANFYMGQLEQRIFNNNKPQMYARYVDDIFIICNNISEIDKIKQELENNSVLKFTYETTNINQQLAFLDTLVTQTEKGLHTSVFTKPTNNGTCLSGNSNCPTRYKRSVIYSYLNRAYNTFENWSDIHTEFAKVKSLLVNNNYSNRIVDEAIKTFLEQKFKHKEIDKPKLKTVNLYYRGQMHKQYEIDERKLKNIIHNNVHPTLPATQPVKLNIYYKSKIASNTIARNSPPTNNLMQKTNVVYSFTCPLQHGTPNEYVGHTRTTLSRRLTMHLQGGNITNHMITCHKQQPTREQLTDNTTIITTEIDPQRLKIKEALHILARKPKLNQQGGSFSNTLQLIYDKPEDIRTASFQTHDLRNKKSSEAATNPSVINNQPASTSSSSTSKPPQLGHRW